jgi:hypothetical protein
VNQLTLTFTHIRSFSFGNTYFVINEEKSQISYITMYGRSHHQNGTQSEYDMLGRQYSISALMKQDKITEMHIYVKYEIVSFMRRQFSSLDENCHDSGPQKFRHTIFDKRGAILYMMTF